MFSYDTIQIYGKRLSIAIAGANEWTDRPLPGALFKPEVRRSFAFNFQRGTAARRHRAVAALFQDHLEILGIFRRMPARGIKRAASLGGCGIQHVIRPGTPFVR